MTTSKFGILDDFYNIVLSISHSTGMATSLIVILFGCFMAGALYQLTLRVPFLRPWHCQQAGYMLTMAYGLITFPLMFGV